MIFDQWATGVDARTRHSSRRVTPTLILRLDERLNMQGSCFERIAYDKESGEFRWAVSARGISTGKLAGHINAEGYRVIKIGRQAYLAHRLAWFLSNGVWPDAEIDHINGDKADNRIANLREASRSINSQNKRAAQVNNKSCGLLGVTWNKQHGKWQSKIMVNKALHHVGLFDDANVAHSAYLAKKRELHAGCTI